MVKTKFKKTVLREFPDYWRLFQTQHVLQYGARLAEEKRKEDEQF